MRGASPVLVSDDRCRRRFARRRVARLVALAFCQLPVGRHDRQYLGVADMFDTWEWLICSKGLLCRRAVLTSCWRHERKHVKLIHVYGISSSVKSSYDVCLFVVVVTYLKFLATPTPRNQMCAIR